MPKLISVQRIGKTTLYVRNRKGTMFYVGFSHPDNPAVRWSLNTNDRPRAIAYVVEIDEMLLSDPIPNLNDIKKILMRFVAEDTSTNITLGEYYDQFCASYTNWSSASTWQSGKSHLSELVQHFGPSTKLSKITSAGMGKYLGELNQRIAGSSYNRHLRVYSVFFGYAIDPLKLLKVNPVESFKSKKVQEKAIMPLSESECSALINELHPYAKLVVVLLLNTGLRIGELRKLRWDYIDWDGRRYCIEKTKGKKVRWLPLNPIALEQLRLMQSFPVEKLPRLSMARAYPDRFDKGLVLMVKDIKTTLKRAAQRAGINHVHAHRFRHTLATNYWKEKGNLSKLMALLGHSTPRMSLLYAKQTQLDPGELDDIGFSG
tara:strand:+ start:2159 stop:3280 length:1122 start_codon:yes stop_codon:yes gene_type:complete